MELNVTPLQSIKPALGRKRDYGSGKGGQSAEPPPLVPCGGAFHIPPPHFHQMTHSCQTGPPFQICYLDGLCLQPSDLDVAAQNDAAWNPEEFSKQDIFSGICH